MHTQIKHQLIIKVCLFFAQSGQAFYTSPSSNTVVTWFSGLTVIYVFAWVEFIVQGLNTQPFCRGLLLDPSTQLSTAWYWLIFPFNVILCSCKGLFVCLPVANMLVWSSILQCLNVFHSLIQIIFMSSYMCRYYPVLIKRSWIKSGSPRVTHMKLLSLYCSCIGSSVFLVSSLAIPLAPQSSSLPISLSLLLSSSLPAPSKKKKLLEDICHFVVESIIHLTCLYEFGKSQCWFFSADQGICFLEDEELSFSL